MNKDDVENCDVDRISDEVLAAVEADTFWCLSKLLDGIQVINNVFMNTHTFYQKEFMCRTTTHTRNRESIDKFKK